MKASKGIGTGCAWPSQWPRRRVCGDWVWKRLRRGVVGEELESPCRESFVLGSPKE